MDTKLIYSKWLAMALINGGCECTKIKTNKKQPHLMCWEFKVDKNFNEKLSELVNQHNN